MLSEDSLEKLSERLVNRIEELNLYMINKLGEQIVDIGTLTPSQLHEVFQSVKYGNNLDDIVYKIAEITDKNVNDIYAIFEEVAKQNQEYAKQFYEYKNIKFIPFDENKLLQQQVRNIAQATVNEYLNMSKTLAFATNKNGVRKFTKLSDIYQEITDEAILSISQGRESYNTVMKRTMRELTRNGLRTIDYETGYSRRADSSVRMNIMDGVRRLNRELQTQFGEEFGADGVEVSHHKNSAPDHIDTVDGQQFSKKGEIIVKNIKYKDYETVNNSLDRHVGELNCYHFIYSIVLGISKPLYSKEELEADKKANIKGFDFDGEHYTMYEGTQLQRQIETKIRQYKDRQIGAKAINDMDEVYHCETKIRQLTGKYQKLSDVSGLPTKVDRLRVEGYKSIKINKNISVSKYKDVTQEWLDTANPNSHRILDRDYFEHGGIKYDVDGKNVILDYSSKERDTAEWLENTFGGELYMMPRINKPDGIQTADYLFKNEYWDLKEIKNNGKNVIDNRVNGLRGQTSNFIFDISGNLLDDNQVMKQIEKMYNSPKRDWVDKVILVRDKSLIKIYKRNKKD